MEILNFTSNRAELRQYNGHHWDDGGFVTVYTYDSDGSGYERAVYHSGQGDPSVQVIRNELLNGGFIVGPTTVYIGTYHTGGYNWYNGFDGSLDVVLHYAIQRKNNGILTSNRITIPAINGLGWAVTLEQSTDLANWTAVAPGTVTGTDSLQFYRVRVTSNASSGE